MKPLACFVVALSLTTLVAPAHAQQPAPPSSGDNTQLDRIERKLDEVLRRLNAANPPSPAPAGAPEKLPVTPALAATSADYKPGALAIVHAAPTTARAIAEVPADSVGGFVYSGGALPFYDLSGRGVRYVGPVGIELQGWLKAAESGRYQIAEELRGQFGNTPFGVDCLFAAWLEDRQLGIERTALNPSIGQEREPKATLVLGADLQPGLYKLRIWTACLPGARPRDVKVTADLLIKAPSDLNLRAVRNDELLHKAD